MHKPLRVLLGTMHIAGDLWDYRQGLRRLGVDARVVVWQKHPFGYPADVEFNFKGNKYVRVLKRLPHIIPLIRQFDVFHFIFGSSFLPPPYNFDVYLLKLLKKKIVMQFVGEIRPVQINEKNDDLEIINKRIAKKKKMIMFWEKHADAIISSPECSQLLIRKYYPLPLGYDLEHWRPFKSNSIRKDKNKALIVHAPSNRDIKGTKYILSAIEQLVKEGHNIEFKLLENMHNSEVREWLNASDIVVDQILGGWYGSLSTEAMAMEKPALCYLDKQWFAHPYYAYAKDLPLVNTTPENIYGNLKRLIENPKLRKEIGKKGRAYVERVHDARKVAKKLLALYESL